MQWRLNALALAGLLVLARGSASLGADVPLDILYQDRPPYYVTTAHGIVTGLVAGPVREALDRAAIATTWKVRPGKRQIETIRQNTRAICSPGWFKMPAREAFSKFNDPIHKDRPQLVILLTGDVRALPHQTLADLFKDSTRVFGAKLAYSYCPYVDGLIASTAPRIQHTPQDVSGMVRMLIGRRFDYMLAAGEEFDSLQANQSAAGSITGIELSDIPPGNRRYLMCSKSVPDAILARFNTALQDMRP